MTSLCRRDQSIHGKQRQRHDRLQASRHVGRILRFGLFQRRQSLFPFATLQTRLRVLLNLHKVSRFADEVMVKFFYSLNRIKIFFVPFRNNPSDESAYLNRAITRSLLRDAAGAAKDFDAALKLSPNAAHIYYNRGNLFASMGKK